MQIDPQIAALRSDKALQRRVQSPILEAKRAWNAMPATVAMLKELSLYGEGCPLEKLQHLSQLVQESMYGAGFIEEWNGALLNGLQAQPLGLVPFRQSYSPGLSTMQIAFSGRATLSLLVYEEVAEQAIATSAFFADREQHEIILRGEAKACLYDLGEPYDANQVSTHEHVLSPGKIFATNGRDRARNIAQVRGILVVLQLSRESDNPSESREIRLSDGALIHQACADKGVSQQEMALALLGAMGRADAAPTMDVMTHEGPMHLRWQALRHCLALDPVLGFGRLSKIAAQKNDDLSCAAMALRKQLTAKYPQFLQQEVSCPV